MHWILFHGWGFSSSHFFNRGYYGAPRSIDPKVFEEEHVVFAHSFGLHFVPPLVKKLVILGGFTHLDSTVLLKRLKNNPEKALAQFYQRCGGKKPDGTPNVPLLLADLERMQERLDVTPFVDIEVDIFHGTEDRIVPLEKGLELHSLLPKSRMHIVEGGSHCI